MIASTSKRAGPYLLPLRAFHFAQILVVFCLISVITSNLLIANFNYKKEEDDISVVKINKQTI